MDDCLTLRRRAAAASCFCLCASLSGCGQTTRGFDEVQDSGAGQVGSNEELDAGSKAMDPSGLGGSSGGQGIGGQGAGGEPNPDEDPDPPEPDPDPPEPDPDPVSDCTERSRTEHDPNSGHTWTSVWYCGNDSAARLYEKPNATNHVGFMDTTNSWFVCYRRGAQHAGQNDVWYYTQGDRATTGWGGRAAWGYMAAVNVHTRFDPNPGIPECPFE